MSDTKEITVIDVAPSVAISQAIQSGADLDKIERLLDLQMRWEANEAKKAYHKAMSLFKETPPEIEKDRHVRYETQKGVTEYDHASLANVTKKINAGLSKHGLSAAWTNTQDNGNISVTCRITHEMGHSEETTLTAAPDTSGSKNSIQAIGSTISYLQRYTLLSLTGLATEGQDDDGQGSEVQYIDEKQVSSIRDMLDNLPEGINKEKTEKGLLERLGCESIEMIPADKFNNAMAALKATKDAWEHK